VLVSFCLQLNVTMYVFIVWLILLIIFCYQLYHDDGLKSETFNSVMYSRYVVGQYSIVMAVALVITALWWICYVHHVPKKGTDSILAVTSTNLQLYSFFCYEYKNTQFLCMRSSRSVVHVLCTLSCSIPYTLVNSI